MTSNGIYQMRHEGRGPNGARIGNKLLFDLAEVERWEAEQLAAEAARRSA